MSGPEKVVTAIFLLTALAWIVRPWVSDMIPWLELSDTTIALIATVLLFILPASFKKLEFLMSWKEMRRLPWNVLLLFGGGLSLAAMIRRTGLADWIAGSLNILGDMPPLMAICAGRHHSYNS